MAVFRLDPPKPGLSSKEYREYVKKSIRAEIKRLGVDGAMEHKDFVIFYSGPSGVVIRRITSVTTDNKKRSLEMAMEMDASRIVDTQAAISLNGHDLYAYFKAEYSKIFTDPKKIKAAINDAYSEVWGGISELFSELNLGLA